MFTVIALESINLAIHSPQVCQIVTLSYIIMMLAISSLPVIPLCIYTQVLVLAPTREIALQIEQVICSVGQCMTGLHCHSSIGGLSLKDDREKVKKAHIVIGTPGKSGLSTLFECW